jgi:hypothetical protein
MPIGKKIAPARRKPHAALPKQKNMCVSHAMKHVMPIKLPIMTPSI